MPDGVWLYIVGQGGRLMSVQGSRGEEPKNPRVWTVEAVRQLGMTTDLRTAASVLGIGRTLAYDLVRDGEFPVRLLHLGRRVLVPVPALLEYLGVTPGNRD